MSALRIDSVLGLGVHRTGLNVDHPVARRPMGSGLVNQHLKNARRAGDDHSVRKGLCGLASKRRNQSQEPGGVGDEARGHEQGAGHEQHESLDQLDSRKTTFGALRLDPSKYAQSLLLDECGAHEARHDDDGKSATSSDPGSQLDEQIEFEGGEEDEEQEQVQHASSLTADRGEGKLGAGLLRDLSCNLPGGGASPVRF